MEHLPDEQGFVEEAYRCLKPEGELVVTLPIEVGVGGWLRYLQRTSSIQTGVIPQTVSDDILIIRWKNYGKPHLAERMILPTDTTIIHMHWRIYVGFSGIFL